MLRALQAAPPPAEALTAQSPAPLRLAYSASYAVTFECLSENEPLNKKLEARFFAVKMALTSDQGPPDCAELCSMPSLPAMSGLWQPRIGNLTIRRPSSRRGSFLKSSACPYRQLGTKRPITSGCGTLLCAIRTNTRKPSPGCGSTALSPAIPKPPRQLGRAPRRPACKRPQQSTGRGI